MTLFAIQIDTINNFAMFIHLTEIVVFVMIVISSVTAEEEPFTIPSFPPRICQDRNNNIYNTVLPESVMAALITGMIAIIGWIIYKVEWTSTQIKKSFM